MKGLCSMLRRERFRADLLAARRRRRRSRLGLFCPGRGSPSSSTRTHGMTRGEGFKASHRCRLDRLDRGFSAGRFSCGPMPTMRSLRRFETAALSCAASTSFAARTSCCVRVSSAVNGTGRKSAIADKGVAPARSWTFPHQQRHLKTPACFALKYPCFAAMSSPIDDSSQGRGCVRIQSAPR